MHEGVGAILYIFICLIISVADGASTRAAKSFLQSGEDADRSLASLTSDSETVVDHDTYSAITGIAPELSLLLDSRASHGMHADPQPPTVPPVQEPEDVDVDGMGGAAVKAEKDAWKKSEKGAKVAARDSSSAVKENQHKAEIHKDLEEDAKTAAELTGVKPNKHGDTNTFKVTCVLNSGIVLLIFAVFSVLRKSPMFKMAFCGNVYATGPPVSARGDANLGKIPEGQESSVLSAGEDSMPLSPSGRTAPPESPGRSSDAGEELVDPTASTHLFGWILPSFWHDVDDAVRREGLDAALIFGFCDLGMNILGTIGFPMVCIMCPLHYYYGGDAAEDQLSSIAMGNVINKHPWMYMLHALIVLAVTRTVVLKVFAAMDKLLARRYQWLKQLPAPRCKTVLVQNIPEEWRSDDRLLEFFQKVFPNKVASAKIVKDAPELQARFNEEEYNKASLRSDLQTLEEEDLRKKAESLGATEAEITEASSHLDKKGPLIHLIIESIVKKSKEASMDKASTMSDKVQQLADTCVGCRKTDDRIAFYEKEITRLEPQVSALRTQAVEQAKDVGGINVASGFVTFYDRREAEICHTLTMSKDLSEWRISKPPPASDVRYDDLKPSDHYVTGYKLFGHFLVCLLYIVYLPITCLGANLEHVVDFGIFQPIWASFAPGLALMLFLSFLPTVFLLIFRSFFYLLSDTFAQHTLQIYYTYFLIFFVILVTVIGRSLLQTLANVAREPGLIFELMATQMPTATHFYMDFLMIQWWDEAKALLRPFVTFKYLVFQHVFGYSQEDSRELAEPEDQDFDGIGARSSHLVICLLVGLVFSTLSPLIALLGFVFFAIARVVYGYLIIYAETRKPDLGGVFYHKQLQIVLEGLMIYNCLMIGVLMFRARTKLPMLMATPSLIYTYIQYKRFCNDFVWQSLPLDEVCLDKLKKPKDNGLRYYQAELQAEYLKDGSDPEAEKAVFLQRTSTRNLASIGAIEQGTL